MNRLQQRSRSGARWPRREPLRDMPAWFAALLVGLSLSAAGAKQPEPQSLGTQDPAPAMPADQANSIGELPAPIVIQGEELRPDDSMRQFRDTLAPSAGASERRPADGSVELVTRFGRFCLKPLPPYLQPRIGGEVTLAARCTSL